MASIQDKPCPERLAIILQLPSLEHRRIRGDMIDIYKYLHGIYNTDNPKFQLQDNSITRGHCLKLTKGRSRLQVRSNFFTERLVVNVWNILLELAVMAASVDSSKPGLLLDARSVDLETMFTPLCHQ